MMAKERPILFSGPMVRAILDGCKTQTRRVCKALIGQSPSNVKYDSPTQSWMQYGAGGVWMTLCCPYGVPGDTLYVREMLRRSDSGIPIVTHAEDHCPVWHAGTSVEWMWKRKTLASRFMPRWASRITLEVTDVRVERAQEISEKDAYAEAAPWISCDTHSAIHEHPREDFQVLWNSINAKRGFGWEANPWIWAITFKRVRDDG